MKMPVHKPINRVAGKQRRTSRRAPKKICLIFIFIANTFLNVFNLSLIESVSSLSKIFTTWVLSLLKIPHAGEIFQEKRGTTLAAKGPILGKQSTTGLFG